MNTTRSVSSIVTNGEGRPIMSFWYGMPYTIILLVLNLWYFVCTSCQQAPRARAHTQTHTYIHTHTHTHTNMYGKNKS
jgi:hypothetical protein